MNIGKSIRKPLAPPTKSVPGCRHPGPSADEWSDDGAEPIGLVGREVEVYWNLHRLCWSVRDRKTGRVIAHTMHVVLEDARFKVSEAGRQRVLAERRKNVHAVVTGRVVDQRREPFQVRVRYNPYRAGYFYAEIGGAESPVYSADRVLLIDGEVYVP